MLTLKNDDTSKKRKDSERKKKNKKKFFPHQFDVGSRRANGPLNPHKQIPSLFGGRLPLMKSETKVSRK